MKFKGISMLAALAFVAFGFSVVTASAAEVVIEAETTLALCSDGIDNDDNGATDLADGGCADFVVEEAAVIVVPETTAELCSDGLDNDDNGSVDLADSGCAAHAVVEPVAENTAQLCSDGIDNNDNGSTDLADPDCAPFAEVENPVTTTPENTAELCADGLDNDDDGSIDLADVDCAAYATPEDNGGNNGGDNGSGGGSGSSSRGSGSRRGGSSSSQGEVLGAFTGSCPFITSYMRMGWANDVEQVKSLQEFLNTELGISLPVTGFYGELTQNAVNAFQLKYKDQVLQPWVDAGLHESSDIPTGFVYITTAHMINTIVCPDFDEELPALVPAGN
jgi:hypothetical protein